MTWIKMADPVQIMIAYMMMMMMHMKLQIEIFLISKAPDDASYFQ